ncbi:MAG: type I glyceraldehyde-3-phosphate dehydrogenase [Candidatus Levybacteria bacterium]|nr:type I glyceraldehyde-3-phosphate dehydrogenase [Candidatus Levybacteria bacterium]
MVRLAINGYGRIGRIAHRIILDRFKSDVSVVGINAGSSADLKGWMYLLKYDTVYGPLTGHTLSVEPQTENGMLGMLLIDDKKIPVYSQKDPSLLPWMQLGIDVVIESTGHFLTTDKAKAHLQAGAKAVILSAPAKDDTSVYVLSINQKDYKGEPIVSNASCTTNCIAPVAKIMHERFGIEKAMMTTIHGYTSDQRLQDGGHKDYRRARAASENIIPTSTGATRAAARAFPALTDRFSGLAIRVPVPVGSLSDFTFLLKKDTTKEEINAAMKEEAEKPNFSGILAVTDDPIVSSDIIGNAHSAIVDLSLTDVVLGNMAKVIAWYDNEFGYAHRLVEQALLLGRSKK